MNLADNMSTEEMESPRKQGYDLYILLTRIILLQNHLNKFPMIRKNTLFQLTKEIKIKFNPQLEILTNKIVPYKIHKFYLDGIMLNQLDNIQEKM